MADPKTVDLRGEGGVVWTFDLPLSPVHAEQVQAGKLVAVDEDSAKAIEPYQAPAIVGRDDSGDTPNPGEVLRDPARVLARVDMAPVAVGDAEDPERSVPDKAPIESEEAPVEEAKTTRKSRAKK